MADFTGHGASSAFVSMIGNLLLNEIVGQKQTYNTGEILDELNKGIINALNQNTTRGAPTDGMDISIVRVDNAKKELQASTANQQIILIDRGEFLKIKGNSFSIGEPRTLRKELRFETMTFSISENCQLYLSSDGYYDQFSENNEKYTHKRFVEIIKKNYMLPFDQQESIFEEEYYKHKGSIEQIDDVLVVGLDL